MCQVINFKQYGSVAALNEAFGDRWVHIGRANSHAGLPASPLANPFKVRDFGGRGQTLPHYRRWLWQRIQAGDEAVISALSAIDESTVLVCWCKPGPCHGDIVRDAAAWLQTGGITKSNNVKRALSGTIASCNT
jgi:hypothetical protein